MKRTIKAVGILLMVAALTTSCGSDDEDVNEPVEQEQEPKDDDGPDKQDGDDDVVYMLPETKSVKLTTAQRTFVDRSNVFAFNLYRALSTTEEGKKSNVASPLSVTWVLGMLNDGAQGQTAKEIASLWGLDNAEKDLANGFCQALIEQAPSVDSAVRLRIANLVAADKTLPLEQQYVADMQQYYHAETAQLDFAQTAEALDYLNGWCNEKTEGMIPKILDDLSPATRLVLMNAILLKATWTEKFDAKDTREETFTTESGSQTTMPLMHRKALALYGEHTTFTSLTLPYGSGDKWSMVVLLPNEGRTVDDVISILDASHWKELVAQQHAAEVDIKMPRFKTTSEFTLNKVLAGMGAPSMFDAEKADFSLMCESESLFVSLMKQKAAIEVDEEGTKASAVTATMMEASAMIDEPKKVTFFANRPFVYLIREASSGTVFFIGTFKGV